MANLKKKEYELMFGHLGNGITVWNTKQEKHGDYVTVAHISATREVKFYEELPKHLKQKIIDCAKNDNPTVSTTQDQPVFNTKSK